MFILFIITPLASLRNVRHLGWTSMMAILAIIFFVATVISKRTQAAAGLHEAGMCIESDDVQKGPGSTSYTTVRFTVGHFGWNLF